MQNPLKAWQEKRALAATEKAREKAAIAAEKARVKAEAEEAARVAARKAAMAAEAERIRARERRATALRQLMLLFVAIALSPVVIVCTAMLLDRMYGPGTTSGYTPTPQVNAVDRPATPASVGPGERPKAATDFPVPPEPARAERTWVDAHMREGKPVKGHWRRLK